MFFAPESTKQFILGSSIPWSRTLFRPVWSRLYLLTSNKILIFMTWVAPATSFHAKLLFYPNRVSSLTLFTKRFPNQVWQPSRQKFGHSTIKLSNSVVWLPDNFIFLQCRLHIHPCQFDFCTMQTSLFPTANFTFLFCQFHFSSLQVSHFCIVNFIFCNANFFFFCNADLLFCTANFTFLHCQFKFSALPI